MKKIVLFLGICLCSAGMWAKTYVMKDTCHVQDSSHKIWFTIEDLGDQNYQLAFWADSVGGMRNYAVGGSYLMTNYSAAERVPWHRYAANIRSILNIGNVDHIGSFALNNITNLRYFSMPDDVVTIGDSAFLGCTNLKTVEWRLGQKTPVVGQGVFITDRIVDADYPNGKEQWVNVLVVPNAAYIDTLSWTYGTWDAVRLNCHIISAHDTWNDVTFIIGESDSISQGLKLSIDNWDGSKVIQVPDRGSDPFPWDAFGDQIEDLVINDNISYIGWGAFNMLTNLKSIQFRQQNHPIDSMSLSAFDTGITPWKFALGDPQDGPIVPPVLKDFSGTTFHFKDSTVLYVPDSTFEYKGEMVRSIDLYKKSTDWKRVFNKITDRTVDSKEKTDSSVVLKWLPLEMADGYRLTIREVATGKDTSIVIPAFGLQGLIDWANLNAVVPQHLAARRAPKEDTGGGLTLTIRPNTGQAHNEDVEVETAGLNSKDYTYAREVLKNGYADAALTKKGTFSAPEKATAIDQLTVPTDRTVIYDMLGRIVGDKIDALSNGIYIVDKGGVRTTILLRR